MSLFRRKISVLVIAILFVQFVPQTEAVRLSGTTWYLRNTTASATFGTTGPTAEYSSGSDLISTSPASKTTALSMSDTPAASVATIAATETSVSAGPIWVGTFLSPKLMAQTLNAGAVFRYEAGMAESNLSADMTFRINVYLWREGTGFIQTIYDGVPSTDCGAEPGAAGTIKSEVCLTTATSSSVTIQENDQIALEVWINSANVLTTSYTGTLYYNGFNFVGNGSASRTMSSPRAAFSVSQYLYYHVPTEYSTVWYLRSDNAVNSFGTTGPTAEYSSASDMVTTSPSNKTVSLSMSNTPGSSQTSLSFAENKSASGAVWLGTFISPLLASQTIAASAGFRLESGFLESSLSANFTERIHVYQWREGVGFVQTLYDGVPSTNCGAEPGAASSERSEVCTFTMPSAVTIQDGDQLALEIWAYADNASTTNFTGAFYYEGNSFIENGTASHVISSAMSTLYITSNIKLLSTLSAGIVNSSGVTVGSPSVSMSGLVFSDSGQISTGTLGSSSQKIRVANWSSNNTWTLSLAATSGASALWKSDPNFYDYNDGSGYSDGSDSDSYGGQLTINPGAGTLTPVFGCTDTSGISKGSSLTFDEGSGISSVSLLIAGSLTPYNCAWDFTGVALSQKVPSRQMPGTYSISFMLTVL